MAMVISRKYEVIGQLGHAGMGLVYQVRHILLDTILAIKVLPAYLMENQDMVNRFYREARIMARLRHPNIVRGMDIERDEEMNLYYFVMEYIQGKTLRQYLQEKGSLPLPDVLEMAHQVGKALAYAHNHTPPVIHRDIKPANIMIEDGSGRVVVMDFGIAKELKELDESEMTRSGVVVGTLKYCSPEQMRHEPLSGSVDIYALGMMMYEAYTGAHLFADLEEHAVIGKVLYDPEENAPSFAQPTPPGFVALVTKAIAKSRDRRYLRMEDFLHDLQACQDLWYTNPQLTQKLEQRVAERTQELQEVNRQLEAASRHKSEFLARMSHELRTPMNAIIGFTRLVMRRSQDMLPKRDHENLGKVLISAEHLLTLINDILDLSKVEAGRMEVHAVRFELEPLIDLCLRTIEPLVRSERLRLVKELEGSLPELCTDQDKLKQILMNLLSNAIKFTEAGTITITARCREGEVILSVADTGIGIPTEHLMLVFEEFHQVDSSATRQYSGTGLGLSISRHFAQLLGGDITIQSTVGVGSTFTVTIPLHYDATRLTTPVAATPFHEALTAETETAAVAPAIEKPAKAKS